MGPTDFELQSVRTVTNNDLDDEPQRPHQTTGLAKGQPALRTRRRSLWTFLFYLFILLAPWILTWILMSRPLNRTSYIVQSGSIGPVETNYWQLLQVVIRSINSAAGVNYETDAFSTAHLPTPGPLMTAALAWFGNGSFFGIIRTSDNVTVSDLCGRSALPFSRVMDRSSDIDWCNSMWQSGRSREELPVDDDS